MRIRPSLSVALGISATLGLLAAPAAAVVSTASASSGGVDVVGLTAGGTSLVRFAADAPDRAKQVGTITGFNGDRKIIGIDYRVQNGKLYGLGNSGGLYTIDDGSAKATKVGKLSVGLKGASFGVDFNPAANALRVVSDTGQNLRQPFGTTGDAPSGATVADGTLNRTAGNPPVTTNPVKGVGAAAYTNNDLSADTGVTLFALDTAADTVEIQSPANSGALAQTGKLGVNAGYLAGLDVYSTVKDGRTVANTAYATIGGGSSYRLYQVDLLTGAASAKGSFTSAVTDIAVPLHQR